MRNFFPILFLVYLSGCTTVSELERVKRGEGEYVLFDANYLKLAEIGKTAFEDLGLVVRKVNHKAERVEILGYQPAQLGESGAVYGLYLYPVGPEETEVYLVRKKRFPTEAFTSDVRAQILSKLDELALKEMNGGS